jgi:carboxylesterase type B
MCTSFHLPFLVRLARNAREDAVCAAHASEIPYVFNNLGSPNGATVAPMDQEVAKMMNTYCQTSRRLVILTVQDCRNGPFTIVKRTTSLNSNPMVQRSENPIPKSAAGSYRTSRPRF